MASFDPHAEPGEPPSPAQLAARLETIHREVRLPDDALVMRGGELQRSDLKRSLKVARKRLKWPGLSVYAADVGTPADLLGLQALPHGQVSFTRAFRLREVGFTLEQTFDWPHHTAWLPEDDPEDDGFWIQMFQSSFEPPVARTAIQTYVLP